MPTSAAPPSTTAATTSSTSSSAVTVASRRRLAAPAALTDCLSEFYPTPVESFPDTPEPWSTMGAGVLGRAAAPSAAAPKMTPAEFDVSKSSKQTHDVEAFRRNVETRLAGLTTAVGAMPKTKSKQLTVRNTFIDVGMPASPSQPSRQAFSCPGSRLVTPQSCMAGQLLSPLHDASVESSAVSTVDTEDAAQRGPQSDRDVLALSGLEEEDEQSMESPLRAIHISSTTTSTCAHPKSVNTSVHHCEPYEVPQPCYRPGPYEGVPPSAHYPQQSQASYHPEIATQQPIYHQSAMHSGYDVNVAQQQSGAYSNMMMHFSAPQPTFQEHQQLHHQPVPAGAYEAGFGIPPPTQPVMQPSPAAWTSPMSSEPYPTLLTGQVRAPTEAPGKPILQLDKVLPVTYQPEGVQQQIQQPPPNLHGPEVCFQQPLNLGSPDMPTLGSAGHGTGECKPCAFYWKPQGCGNGINCVFCHLCDSGEKKRRAKEKRVAVRMAKASGMMM